MARDSPTTRGRCQVEPASGTRAMPEKARRQRAASLASRRSQARASDTPAPAATPLTTATVGLGIPASSRQMGA
jgi:hypothetical protein